MIINVAFTTKIKRIRRTLNKFWHEINTGSNPTFLPVFLSACNKSGKLIGFLYAYDIYDGYYRELTIDDLFVKRAFRNKGVATQLMTRLLNYVGANKIKKVIVKTCRHDLVTYKLYRKFGFKISKNDRLWYFENEK